ncbi:MAG: TonB-dependent siderophore receptor [Woeseiaceae bacterium]
MKRYRRNLRGRGGVAVVTATFLLAGQAAAQESGSDEQEKEASRGLYLEEVVVTGRSGASERTKLETSYSITTKTEVDIREFAPLSATDFLKTVPGFWVEASGGESNGNVRARGIPLDGFATIGLHEDGLPLQHDPGIGWLNADQVLRLDETIERVEVVRGGPSVIFSSNAPGGLVNFVTKKGSDVPEGVLKYTIGDYNLQRADFFYGGPLSDEWNVAVGGYYRRDDGIREPGFTANDGGQLRLTLSREFTDGRLDLSVRRLNDRTFFALPIPLTFDESADPTDIPGFDANTDTTLGPDVLSFEMKTPDGLRRFDLSRGTDVDLTAITINFEKSFGDWQFSNRFRYRDSDVLRNSAFPNTPVTAEEQLDAVRDDALAAFAGATDVTLEYTRSGDAFDVDNQNGNGLVMTSNYTSVHTPLREAINDIRLSRLFDVGTQTHDVSFGAYFATYDITFDRLASLYLTEVRGQPRLLDILAVDGAGNTVGRVTDNGVVAYGTNFQEADDEAQVRAFYVTDEWQITDGFRLDAGLRWEEINARGTSQLASAVDLEDPDTLADDSVLTGNGVFLPFDRTFDDLAVSIGGNFNITDDSAVFGRYTTSFSLPDSGTFRFAPDREITSVDITQIEGGYKMISDNYALFATLFFTKYENVEFTNTVVDPLTGDFTEQREFADTETLGIEFEGFWSPVDLFELSATFTWQDAQFKNFAFNELSGGVLVPVDFSGNLPIRIPEVAISIKPTVVFLDGRLRVYSETQFFSERFGDAANSVELPEYTAVNAGATYFVNDATEITVSAHNITDETGLTEGNPRAGQFTSGDAGNVFFLARPIFGRSIRASIAYRF